MPQSGRNWDLLIGDCRDMLATLTEQSVQTCITSPPYWGLRDYGVDGQIGLEETPDDFLAGMVDVFAAVWRVLRDDGTCWVNMGDSYAASTKRTGRNDAGNDFRPGRAAAGKATKHIVRSGLKPKDLCGMPWRLAFALQSAGWYLRSDIIWSKPNPMPESCTDRPTKAHEYVFLLTKRPRYFYDADAVRETAEYGRRAWSCVESVLAAATTGSDARPHHGIRKAASVTGGDPGAGRNRRTVWTIPTQAYSEAHFATFPEALVVPCVLAGSREGDTVLDPFTGSGTTGKVAVELGRRFVGCELSPEYAELAAARIRNQRKYAAPNDTTTTPLDGQGELF